MTPTNKPAAGDARLRRLFWLRNVSIAGQVLAIAVAQAAFSVELPVAELALVVGLLVAANAGTAWRLTRAQPAGDHEVFGQLVVDVMLLSFALHLTGGATNPFVSLYLLPLVIAAIILPLRHAWAMALLTAAAYTLMMFWYRPLAAGHAHHADSFGLHVLGMWFNFIVSAGLVAFFVARMAASLRERDRELAAARERALRDEQLVALGTFAAGAAHELGTPLSTIAVLVNDFERSAGADPETREDLATLRAQVEVCKRILTDMASRAGRPRSEGARLRPLNDWIEDARTRWQVLRPLAALRVVHARTGACPRVAAEETTIQALVSLLNNAADACPEAVELFCDWDEARVTLEVRDRGSGISVAARQRAGREPYSDKPGRGLGLGLLLARAAIERLGGTLEFADRPEGGAATRVSLPIGVAA